MNLTKNDINDLIDYLDELICLYQEKADIYKAYSKFRKKYEDEINRIKQLIEKLIEDKNGNV